MDKLPTFLVSLLLLGGCSFSSPFSPDQELEIRAGSALAGERLQNGECPTDETCDPITTGANFSGSWDVNGLSATAVGGAQYISVWVQGADVAVTASSSDPSVFEIVEEVQVQDTPFASRVDEEEDTLFKQVRVRGVAAGEAFLELRDSEGLLVDRLAIPVTSAQPPRILTSSAGSDPELGAVRAFCVTTEPWMVDRELRVSAAVTVVQNPVIWFCFAVEDSTEAAIPVTVTFAGTEHMLEVPAP